MRYLLVVALLVGMVGGGEAMMFYNESHLQSVTLTDDGRIEVVRTKPSAWVYPEGGSPPGVATKEIYVARGGKIVLDNTITGYYYPESTEVIPSRIEWK